MQTEKKILIVDDDPRNIFALKATLAAKGFSVVTAKAAEEAFEVLDTDKRIAVVLMDMMMPDTDGYEATENIKAHPHHKDIKVIAVTAKAMQNDRQRCLNAGADEYISKPINVDVLLRLLNEYLN
jgi:two-component system cell cycle response regulator DivK